MKQIILASTSPRRKTLLKQIKIKFKAVASDYEENMALNMKPKDLAKYLSQGKAIAVLPKYPNSIIIAADTFVVFNNKILGKPHTPEQAIKTLKMISGKTLDVITGLTVIDGLTKKKISRSVTTKVYIRKLSMDEIKEYVATGEPLDKAGAFGIQEKGVLLVKKISGSYSNVVGLPLVELWGILKKLEN